MPLLTNPTTQESRVRRRARREGFMVRKSRAWPNYLDNHGEFMLVDPSYNIPVLGYRYDASLDDIEAFLRE